MENITKEELLKSLGENVLSEEDLEKISGGGGGISPEQARACADKCSKSSDSDCLTHCLGIGR